MSVFLGVDGGGTQTRTLLVDDCLSRAWQSRSGPTNINHVSHAELRQNLQHSIEQAFASAGASPSDCRSAFLGMAGVTSSDSQDLLRRTAIDCGLSGPLIGVDHDIRIALAGGLCGRPGIALIVGTGSSCYGRDDRGHTWQTGGWEALISDEGSGFYIGREAIGAAARMADGRAPETGLKEQVFRWLGIRDLPGIIDRMHRTGLGRTEIASLAPAVITLAEAGDLPAERILDRGAALLAELVEANHRCLPTSDQPELVMVGGLVTASGFYRKKIEDAVLELVPEIRIRTPFLPPVAGAVLLAMDLAGRRVSQYELDRLRSLLQ